MTALSSAIPNLVRRRLLLGLAAASTAAAGGVAGAPALAAAPAENPDLYRLSDEVEAAHVEYRAAEDRSQALLQEGRRRWPKVPDELYVRDKAGEYVRSDRGGRGERDFDGGARWGGACREVLGAYEARGRYDEAMDALRNKRLQRTGKLYGKTKEEWARRAAAAEPVALAAAAYYGECARVHKEVDYHANGWPVARDKRDRLANLTSDLMSIEVVSMAGVVMKAQALRRWGEVGEMNVIRSFGAWEVRLATDVLRFAEDEHKESEEGPYVVS